MHTHFSLLNLITVQFPNVEHCMSYHCCWYSQVQRTAAVRWFQSQLVVVVLTLMATRSDAAICCVWMATIPQAEWNLGMNPGAPAYQPTHEAAAQHTGFPLFAQEPALNHKWNTVNRVANQCRAATAPFNRNHTNTKSDWAQLNVRVCVISETVLGSYQLVRLTATKVNWSGELHNLIMPNNQLYKTQIANRDLFGNKHGHAKLSLVIILEIAVE